MIPRLWGRFFNLRWNSFNKSRRILNYAPYNLSDYQFLLKKLKRKYYHSFLSFCVEASAQDKPNLFIRYDLDTLDCLQKASQVIKVSHELGLPSAAFLRTDGLDYSLADLSHWSSELKSLGIPLGLHSSCYIAGKNWMDALRAEILHFESIIGYSPELLTVHGLGEFEKAAREEFSTTVATHLEFEGKKLFLDYPPARSYFFVFQDCWQDSEKKRILYSEFRHLPPLKNGENYLVLIHPCYWN